MEKRKLTFYTNIPTPYQDDFFSALADYFKLTVVYYARKEADRQWSERAQLQSYRTVWLRDELFSRWIQRWIKDYHFSWSIVQSVDSLQADYVIVSGSYWVPNSLIIMITAGFRGKRVAFFGEQISGSPLERYGFVKRLLLWPLKKACVRVFAIGSYAAHTYRLFGVTCPTAIVPYNINVDRFCKVESGVNAAHDPLVFVSAGSLIPRKGMDTLIKAFNGLDRHRFAHVRLQILGEGPERMRLQKLIDDDDRICLLGFKDADELPNYFKQAHAFVFASRYDGWGVVINEAIAAGLPIISSRTVGAAAEWVLDGVNGFLCDPDDVMAFQRAMQILAEDSNVRTKQANFNSSFRLKTSSRYCAAYMHECITSDLSV